MIEVTNDNYFDVETEREFFTNSQIKAYKSCPAKWQAKRMGFIKEPPQTCTSPLFQGSYVDMALTEPENFESWCAENADNIFQKNGKKYAALQTLDTAVERVKKDKYFMSHLSGKHQIVLAFDDFHGYPFKCKIDDLDFEKCAMTDLKTTGNSMDGEEWARTADGSFVKVHWITYWRYPQQIALYREAVNIKWGFRPHPYIAAMTKKDPVDFEVFDMMPDSMAEMVLAGELQSAVESMGEMAKYTDSDPDELDHCGRCGYCLENKVLDRPIDFIYDSRMLKF